IAVLTLVAWPWSNLQIQELGIQYEQRSDIYRIAPGECQESSDGSRVIFIDKDTVSETAASNIVLVEQRQGREFVTSVKSAHLKTHNEQRYAVLDNGQRVETGIDDGQLKVTHFDTYKLRMSDSHPVNAMVTARALSTMELFEKNTPIYLSEAAWRIGLPLAA